MRNLFDFVLIEFSPSTVWVIRLGIHSSIITCLVLKLSNTTTDLTIIFCFGNKANWLWEIKDVSQHCCLLLFFVATLTSSSSETEEDWLLLVALGADDTSDGPTSSSSRWSADCKSWWRSATSQKRQVRRFSTTKGCSTLQCTFRMTRCWQRHSEWLVVDSDPNLREFVSNMTKSLASSDSSPPPAYLPPSPCPLLSQFWMTRIRFDRMDTKAFSIFYGVACISDATWLCAQFVGDEKSSWQSDTAATGLKALSL